MPAGPRARLPMRRKIDALQMLRIAMFVIVTFSIVPPSTVSSASPRLRSKTQLAIVMFLKPPSDSVPNLIRPVGPSRSTA